MTRRASDSARDSAPDPPGLPAEQLRLRLDFEDPQLLAECEVHAHRTGGPGGQHRNKTATAIRLHHRPSGITVTGTERRSQRENKLKAVQRLREAIALYARVPLPERVAWPATVQIVDGCLRINPKNPALNQVIALVLDAVQAAGGRTKEAAHCLGITPSSLTRFLRDQPKAWAEAERIRAAEKGL